MQAAGCCKPVVPAVPNVAVGVDSALAWPTATEACTTAALVGSASHVQQGQLLRTFLQQSLHGSPAALPCSPALVLEAAAASLLPV